MTFWSTKYALTEGIGEYVQHSAMSHGEWGHLVSNPKIVRYVPKSHLWHDRELAVKKAEGMRAKKITLLRAQIAELEALKF